MSIWRNDNEIGYKDGRKHFTDVIKNSGPGELIIWRQPEEDFNTNSTLVVNPGEQAIFVNNGVIEQVFENGSYKLSTENYPFIGRLRNALSGGVSVFHCIVYFVRQSDSAEVKWGTDSPIQVRDKVWGIRADVRTRGSYKFKVSNPAVLLEKLIGNNVPFETQEGLEAYFGTQFSSKIKTTLSKFLNSLQTELIGLDAYLDEMSQKIEPSINDIFSDYGIECVKFVIGALDVDQTKYDEIDVSQQELIAKQREFQAGKAGIEILGDDWARVQGMEVLQNLSENPGAGGVAAAGAGMGMGIGAAGAFGSIAQNVFSSSVNDINKSNERAANRGKSSGRFQEKDGENASSSEAADPVESLSKLKSLLDAGLIEQSEYDNKKQEILGRM